MNLSFFTKIFDRRVQLSSSFGKTFSYVRGACKYKDKVYQADIYRKNNTCTSCVFNGFKYKIETTAKKQGRVTGFELATSITMDKRSIHYATNSPCDWYVFITF